MVVVASRIGGGPSDNGEVVVGNVERWRFDDLDALDSRLRRRILSDDRAAKEQAARRGGGRPYPEQSIHRTNPLSLPLNSRRRSGGRLRPPQDSSCPGPMESAASAPAGHCRYPLRRGIEQG